MFKFHIAKLRIESEKNLNCRFFLKRNWFFSCAVWMAVVKDKKNRPLYVQRSGYVKECLLKRISVLRVMATVMLTTLVVARVTAASLA